MIENFEYFKSYNSPLFTWIKNQSKIFATGPKS